MALRIPQALPPDALRRCQELVAGGTWIDGRETAGPRARQVKNNEQLADTSPAAIGARALVLEHLTTNAAFISMALPRKIFPPRFNRYQGSVNAYGSHVDSALHRADGANGQPVNVRADLSATLFLSDPDSYDGGELVIDDPLGPRAIKLPAGDLVLYEAGRVHRVEPVTRGTRFACFFWIESMVRSEEQRRLLLDLAITVEGMRTEQGYTEAGLRLSGCYHNLLRMWADS